MEQRLDYPVLSSEAAPAPLPDGVAPYDPRHVDPPGRLDGQPAGGKPGRSPVPQRKKQGGGRAPLLSAREQQAFDQGFSEGEQSGAARASAQYREAVAGFGRSALDVLTHKARLQAAAERELVELAFAIARRVLRREVSLDPTVVTGLVRACLEEYDRVEVKRVQVSSQDLEMVRAFFQEQAAEIEVVAAAGLSPGGAVLQTERGTIDARLDTQLEEIERGLADGV